MFVGPIDSECTACGENNDQRLAGGGEGLEEFFLRPGKINVGAVAAEEAGIAVVALFAFEVGGDDDVGFASGVDGFLSKIRRNPEKASEGFAETAEVLELDGVGVAGLETDEGRECALAALAVRDPVVDEDFAIEEEAETAVGAGADAVVAVGGCDQFAGPANRIVFGGNTGSGRDVVPDEVEGRIDAGNKGRTRKGGIREIFGGEPGF